MMHIGGLWRFSPDGMAMEKTLPPRSSKIVRKSALKQNEKNSA